jgi:hypothetical protein
MLALSPSCSGKELITEKQVITFHDVFEDENENWKARYVLNETHIFITANRKTHNYGEHDARLFVTYKGNLSESSSPKQIQISYETGHGGSERCDYFDRKEYILKSYSRSGSIEMRCPVYAEWGLTGIQRLSLLHGINPVWLKEQMPVFVHTIGPVCAPYKTVYVHHEASGGTDIGKNDTIRVTIELDGETEILELRSAQ